MTRVEHRQRHHRVRLEWGLAGVEILGADCAVIVVIDVLSFCTSVDVVVGRGGSVVPWRMSGGPLPAGAVAAGPPDRSPEADLAVAQFAAATDLRTTLAALSSGRELVADGYGADVDLAAAHATSGNVPRLRGGVLSG